MVRGAPALPIAPPSPPPFLLLPLFPFLFGISTIRFRRFRVSPVATASPDVVSSSRRAFPHQSGFCWSARGVSCAPRAARGSHAPTFGFRFPVCFWRFWRPRASWLALASWLASLPVGGGADSVFSVVLWFCVLLVVLWVCVGFLFVFPVPVWAFSIPCGSFLSFWGLLYRVVVLSLLASIGPVALATASDHHSHCLAWSM